jgi:hypothetical protein
MPVMHLALAALTAMPSCWGLYDKALAHSAAAVHPPYITYSERIAITTDGQPLIISFANIIYRDDGMARVSDERFGYAPIFTRNPEPGPPELGPYGTRREMWLPLDADAHTIAAVRAAGRVTCAIEPEVYRSRATYHLTFHGADPLRAHLDDLWVDVRTGEIRKLRITAQGDFEIELGYHGGYLVVDHVTWSYDRRTEGQPTQYFGEYTLTDFSFPKELPASYFAGVTSVR